MVDKQKVEQAIRLLLEGIGEDITREGLIDTPDRIARMCEEIYGGLDQEADHHLLKQFPVENNEIVLEKDITFYCRGLCQKTADPGTPHSTDCGRSGACPLSEGNYGYAGSRTHLHDHARR